MRLLIRDGDDLIEAKSFEANPINVGSGIDCHIRLPDHRLLPNQLTLRPQQDGSWVAEPAEGGLPVVLNSRPLLRPTVLRATDEIRLENFSIVVSWEESDHFRSPLPARTSVPPEAAKLRAHPLPPGAIAKPSKEALRLDAGQRVHLAQFSSELRGLTDAHGLLDHILGSMLSEFDAWDVYAGLRQGDFGTLEFTQGRNREGRVTEEPEGFDTYCYRCLERGQNILIPDEPTPDHSSAMVVPLTCNRGCVGIVYVARRRNRDPFCEVDLDRLVVMGAMLGVQFERILLDQLEVENATSEGQLALLREVQKRMDPTSVPQWPGVQLAVWCKPGTDRVCDVYDLMRIPNGFGMAFIASLSAPDVLRCATAMAEVRTAFRSAALHADAPHTLVRTLNWMLCEDRARCQMSIAVFAMNPSTGELQHCSAGVVGAIVVDERGDSRDLVQHDAPALGTAPNHPYEAQFERLAPKETLALFTEGAWTVTDESGAQLGPDPVVDSIRDGFGQPASAALDDLLQDHAAYFKRGLAADDITIMLFHRVAVPA